jgi:hypothetical protein
MKIKFPSVSALALGLFFCAFSGSPSNAQVVAISFGDSLSPTAVYGAGGGATAGWLNDSETPAASGLRDNTGAVTTAGANFSPWGATALNGNAVIPPNFYSPSSYGSSDPAAIYNTVAYGSNAGTAETLELNLTNIPYTSYNLFVYAVGQYGSIAAVEDFAGTTAVATYDVTTQNTAPDFFTLSTASTNGDYVEFTGLSGGSQTIDLTNTASNTNCSVNAVEIVNTASVPEPSTYAMLFSGVGMFFVLRKYRGHKA